MKNTRAMATMMVCMSWLGIAMPASAQFSDFGEKLKRKVQQSIETETDRKVDQVIDQTMKCVVGDQECAEQAEKEGKALEVVAADGKPVAAGAPADRPGEGVWRNYDYVPGRTVWFSTDFTGDKLGRFPASLEFGKGNAQVVEKNGLRMLEFSDYTEFAVVLPEKLPPDFSLEVTTQTAAPNIGVDIFFSEMKTAVVKYDNNYLRLFRDAGVYFHGSARSSMDNLWKVAEQLVEFKFQADGDYGILYAGAERAANLPNATFQRTNRIYFRVNANGNRPAYIQHIEVAVGVDDLYGALQETGQFTTRGIYFAFDSDQLQPQSTPTLQQLYDALAQHPGLSVIIEGHTDDRGDADYNQKLSARRAAAVVAYLTGRGIAGSRLTAVGRGESEPAASNATAEGREQNRRVVIKVAK